MRNYKLLLISAVIITAILVLPSFRSGQMQMDKKEFAVQEFTEIAIEGSFNVEFTESNTVSVMVEASAEDMEKISVEVKNGTLRLKLDDKHNYNSIKVMASAPHLKAVAIAGSGNFRSTNALTEASVKFAISGSGNAEATVQNQEAKASIAGSGNLKLDGSTKSVKIEIAGSGNAKTNNCTADEVKVNIAGSGSAYVMTNGDLSASIAGSGSVYYSGDPKNVKQDISGSGTVKRKDS